MTLNLTDRVRGDLPLYDLAAVQQYGVDAFLTGRRGGVSAGPYATLNLGHHVGDVVSSVFEKRRGDATAMNVDSAQLVTSSQVHGAVVNDVDEWRGEPLVGDALVTTREDVALCVLVADCVPMLFVESGSRRFAVAHAGWRGLVAGVIPSTLAHFANARDVVVILGPHISPASYQVGPDVADHFEAIEGACHDDVSDRRRLDLAAIALHQLAQGGVVAEHVTLCSPPTDDGATFFSDRAQRPCGRFGLIARRTSYDSRVKGGTK
jgi:hypothetical protein